jgi:hypothetical protein
MYLKERPQLWVGATLFTVRTWLLLHERRLRVTAEEVARELLVSGAGQAAFAVWQWRDGGVTNASPKGHTTNRAQP